MQAGRLAASGMPPACSLPARWAGSASRCSFLLPAGSLLLPAAPRFAAGCLLLYSRSQQPLGSQLACLLPAGRCCLLRVRLPRCACKLKLAMLPSIEQASFLSAGFALLRPLQLPLRWLLPAAAISLSPLRLALLRLAARFACRCQQLLPAAFSSAASLLPQAAAAGMRACQCAFALLDRCERVDGC